jgi:hypothetical protein
MAHIRSQTEFGKREHAASEITSSTDTIPQRNSTIINHLQTGVFQNLFVSE